MTRGVVRIRKDACIRSRPASAFVRAACEFSSHIRFVNGRKFINGKSMMGVLSLGAPQTDELFLETVGPDEEDALEKLLPMAEALFSVEIK